MTGRSSRNGSGCVLSEPGWERGSGRRAADRERDACGSESSDQCVEPIERSRAAPVDADHGRHLSRGEALDAARLTRPSATLAEAGDGSGLSGRRAALVDPRGSASVRRANLQDVRVHLPLEPLDRHLRRQLEAVPKSVRTRRGHGSTCELDVQPLTRTPWDRARYDEDVRRVAHAGTSSRHAWCLPVAVRVTTDRRSRCSPRAAHRRSPPARRPPGLCQWALRAFRAAGRRQ